MIKIKKLCIILLSAVFFLFTGCASDDLKNIDSFCDSFNLISEDKINRCDFLTEYDSDGELNMYCIPIENILINACVDEKTMNIKSVSVTAEKFSDKYFDIIVNIISVIGCTDRETAAEYADKVFSDKEKEYANNMHTLEFISLFYTKTLSGQRFCISYNEMVPSESTVVPETAVEYTFETVTTSS